MAARAFLAFLFVLVLTAERCPYEVRIMPASDFLVQHFNVTMAAGDLSEDFAIPVAVDVSKTRIMLHSINGASGTIISPDGNELLDDRTIGVHMVDGSTVRVLTDTDRTDALDYALNVRFSLMSYVGAPGGPNDFTVYRYAIGRSSWLGQFVNFRGMGLPITVYPKAVLAITGFGNIGDSPSAVLIDRNLGGDKDLDYAVAFNGQSIVSPQQTIRYEITDFHGSNWQIERHNTLAANEFATSGAYTLASGYEDGSTEINSIGSWDEAWIEGWRGGPGSMLLFPIDPTHVGVGWITTSINPSDLAVYGFYVIRNPEIYVEHYGNPEGPGGWLENETILRETLSDLIPLDGATQITESQDRVVPRVYGVLGHYAGGLPTYLSREFGEHDTAALALTYYYEDGVGIRVEHSAPDGALRYAAQVVQFSRPPEASVESLESVVNRPAFDVQIRKR